MQEMRLWSFQLPAQPRASPRLFWTINMIKEKNDNLANVVSLLRCNTCLDLYVLWHYEIDSKAALMRIFGFTLILVREILRQKTGQWEQR